MPLPHPRRQPAPKLGILAAATIHFAMLLTAWPAHPQATPASLADDLQAGQSALDTSHPVQAEQAFRAALALNPNSIPARAGLGVAEWMRGDCPAARPDLSAGFAADPSLLKIEALLGVCEKRLGDPAAESHLQAAFTQLSDPKLRLETGVELGDLYYQRGDLDHAIPIVRQLVALDPENTDILFFAQNVYQQMADQTMNKLALLAPNSARMQQLIAQRLVNGGDLPGAVAHYRQALTLDPALPGARFELAEAILEAAPNSPSAQSEARQQLQEALHTDGDSARLECELARIAYLQGQSPLALAYYQRAYALNPSEIEAQMGISRILVAGNKPDQAIHYLAQATALGPLNAEAHYQYARALKSLHRDQEAASEIQLYQTVRRAQDKLRDLYRQMNKHIQSPADQTPDPEASQP